MMISRSARISTVMILLTIILYPFVTAFVIYRTSRYLSFVEMVNYQQTISDIGFSIFPYVPQVFDYYTNPFAVINLIYILWIGITVKYYYEKITLQLSLGFILRAIFVSSTQLPMTIYDSTYNDCLKYGDYTYSQILSDTIKGYRCGDYFFSGHTFFLTTCWIIMSQFLSKKIFRFLTLMYILAIISLLISRVHYSIDIIGGFTVAILLHKICPHITEYINMKKS
jgi:membrane-associated phospholipid phosphatase